MTIKEATDVEKIVQERIEEELPVYSLVVSLAEARAINSLRAVFGEVYPDPVRVISVGTDVTQLVADPDNEAWNSLSVELCGGTHLSNTKEAEAFALVEETGKAKGIRRMVALTGEVCKWIFFKGEGANFQRLQGLDVQMYRLRSFIIIPCTNSENMDSRLRQSHSSLRRSLRKRCNEQAKQTTLSCKLLSRDCLKSLMQQQYPFH